MLKEAASRGDGLAGALLARHYLERKITVWRPRQAVALMARHAESDLATRRELASLLVDHRVNLGNADRLFFRLQEDEDAGEPDAAWMLLRLLRAGHEQFRDDQLAFELIDRYRHKDDRIALMHASDLVRFSLQPGERAETFARNAREALEALAAKGMAAAWTLKGNLQRKGDVFPQDDVAATEALIQGAELGDVEAMVALAEAYDRSLGTAKDAERSLRWLREAAVRGSIDARARLARRFSFDTFERKMTLREGVTELVALYGDGIGSVEAMTFLPAFKNTRLRDFDRTEVIAAFMDGFRAAPAALEENRLVPLLRDVPREVWAGVETVLKDSGFYDGETRGDMRPDARAALAAWTAAAGPLPPCEMPKDEPPPAGPPLPEIPAAVLDKAMDVAFAQAMRATNDAERAAAIEKLAVLARLGAQAPRWALVRNYHQSRLVRAAVTAEEITRYGLDLLLKEDPSLEKLEIEFAFTGGRIAQDGAGQQFADAFLATLRDDARLGERFALQAMLERLVFVPGGCDMLLEGARARGVELPPQAECAGHEVRDGLLAYARSAGVSGIEAAARAGSVEAVYAIAGVPR